MQKRDEDLATEAENCSKQGNAYPYCLPLTTETWTNGSTHDFIWNFNYPYYVSSPNISIYLYNIVKYAYVSTKNYTNLSTSLGGVEVAVDDSWFLNSLSPGSQNQTVTTYFYILPSTMDPYTELANSNSMYPRPFNFSVLQIAPLANGSTISNSTQNGNNSSNTTSNSTNDDNSSSTHLPGWAIAVICIAVFAILFGAAASIWAVVLTRRNKKQNKLSPSSGGVAAILGGKKREMSEVGSSNSKAHMIKGLQSTDSVANTNSVENASIAGTLNSRNQPKITSSDAMILADSFRNTLGRPTDWNLSGLGQEEEEELKRRKLGETLLQRQLEEDGTSVKHAGRFTRVKSLNDIPKHATLEHPRNQ